MGAEDSRITNWNSLSDDALLQVNEFTRTNREASLIPHGRSTWLDLVAKGLAPSPVSKSGQGKGQGTFWRLEDLRAYLNGLNLTDKWVSEFEAAAKEASLDLTPDWALETLLANPSVEYVQFKRLNSVAIQMQVKLKTIERASVVWLNKPI